MVDLQTLDLILFAVGTFAAALVTGVAGFAFGIVAAAVWLYAPVAGPHNGADRSLRTDRAGHLRLEIAPLDKAGAAIAVPAWRSDRRPNWRRAAALGVSRDLSHFDWNRADPFQLL